MAVKRKKKKTVFRIKTSVKRFFIYALVFILVGVYAFNQIRDIKAQYAYEKTYEYKLVQHGYSLENTQIFLSKLPDEKLDYLLTNDVENYYYDIVSQRYFLTKNFDKYLDYYKRHQSYNMETIIAIVNVHANEGWYNVTYNTDTSLNELMLVNKFYMLDQEYKRDDLVKIPLQVAYADNYVSSTVLEQFVKMHDDIKNELGVNLMVNSSYRSYQDQADLYENFKYRGQSYADSYAARPGFSEHQTGLAIDITSLEHKGQSAFSESEEYQWLKDNCWKYGFILRYPKDKEIITGYSNESWHFRYVGEKVAKKMKDEDLTFDEYYAFYIEGQKK